MLIGSPLPLASRIGHQWKAGSCVGLDDRGAADRGIHRLALYPGGEGTRPIAEIQAGGSGNRILTAQSITDRVLAFSPVATVSTSVLVLCSGNNVGPVRDLARRVLTIKLNAKSQTPGTLSYKGNPVATLRADRERYVNAVLTIIEAWKAAGSPRADGPSIASYGGSWSDYCRQPLLWLGLPDPATALLDQMRNDPDAEQFGRLLSVWHGKHGDKALCSRFS